MSAAEKHIHFIGVGGIGMSALARHYLHEGWQVSGSDATESSNTNKLEAEGVKIVYEQVAANITPSISLVVYTEAMNRNHPELMAAKECGIETINYFEALGRVANEYYVVAVAGAHGKTTTTAMIADILEEASYDPSVVVGSLRSKTGSNYRAGKSKYFVVEACEYKRDFLYLKPDVLVITNVEHEHVDYYKDLADVQSAFREFAMSVPEDGAVICNLHDERVSPVVAGIGAKVIDYRSAISLTEPLRQPGLHNRENAAAARSATAFLGIEADTISTALQNFAGTWRRFEYKGDVNGAHVYDDYAHHPTEVTAAIAGARELYPKKRVVVVFQPHTYSRTKELFADFVVALGKADEVIMVPIYAARENDDGTVSSQMVVDELLKVGKPAEHFETLPAVAQHIKETVGTEDVVLVMGAGSVVEISKILTS